MQLVYSSVPNRRFPKFHHIYGKQALILDSHFHCNSLRTQRNALR